MFTLHKTAYISDEIIDGVLRLSSFLPPLLALLPHCHESHTFSCLRTKHVGPEGLLGPEFVQHVVSLYRLWWSTKNGGTQGPCRSLTPDQVDQFLLVMTPDSTAGFITNQETLREALS
jgi:hypothetical protein